MYTPGAFAAAGTFGDMGYQVEKSDAEWREQLSAEEYAVLRQAGTERAFTGEYTDTETKGVYRCKACQAKLFESDTKFHSGCGWPSFYQPSGKDAEIKSLQHQLLARVAKRRAQAISIIDVAVILDTSTSLSARF